MKIKTILFISFFLLGWGEVYSREAQEEVGLGEVIVTASRMAQYDYKVAGNVTVITQEEISTSNAQSIPDLLKEHLGVHVYDNGSAKSTVLDIRGFGDTASRNVLVLVNDRKINNIDISGPDLIRIPLEAVERIEMIRGAGSVLYGDNAVGGVINVITKEGKGKLSGRAGSVNGSYATTGAHMEVSGAKDFDWAGIKNDVSYYIYSRYHDTKGYRVNSDLLTKDYDTRFSYKVSERLKIDLNMGWHEDDQGLPGGLSETELKTLGRRGSADSDDLASTKDRFVQLTFDVNPWPEDLNFGSLVLDFSHRNRDVYDAFFSFGESSTKRSIDSDGLSARYIFDKEVFNKEVNFVTGVDYYENENDILGSGSNPDNLTISKDEWGVFGYLEYEMLNDIFTNAGTRFHKADYQFTQRNVIVDEQQHPEETVSMAGMRYEYANGSNLHFNVQQTFRFLATDEWYNSANFPDFGITPGLNTNLKQQTGIQYETGIKHNFNDTFLISVTPYWMDIKNEIFFDPVGFKNSNYDKTRRIGVEAGGTLDLLKFVKLGFLDKLEFFSNYTFQDTEFRKGANDGKEIPLVPRYQTSHGFTAGFFKYYRVSLMGRYVGSRFAINDTTNITPPIKPYYVFDMKLAYERKNFEMYVALNNLFDEKYFTYVSKSAFSNAKDYFPAAERNFTVGVDFKF